MVIFIKNNLTKKKNFRKKILKIFTRLELATADSKKKFLKKMQNFLRFHGRRYLLGKLCSASEYELASRLKAQRPWILKSEWKATTLLMPRRHQFSTKEAKDEMELPLSTQERVATQKGDEDKREQVAQTQQTESEVPNKESKSNTATKQDPKPERIRTPLPKEKEKQVEHAFQYCIAEVQLVIKMTSLCHHASILFLNLLPFFLKQEPQTFLALQCLKCNETQKLGIIVLHAFNLELSRIRNEVKDSEPAKMRLNWWLSNVETIVFEEMDLREAHYQRTSYSKHIANAP
ncbi:hypothetical protein RFI_26674, partial [Reticulomyxa filosa]